ncbi:MAG TPA: radical SAM protein, partial [Verrucomicrobiae bacterium]|nr:radical SAM protein [Verrucomicrobiae bacterium]
LEVAMGLETAHPQVLDQLNKRFNLDDFARAANRLRQEAIALRVFVLIKPPFMSEAEGLEWAVRSAEFAFDCGATAVSLIPTRPGNGALEALAAQGHFAPPRLATVEAALERGLALGRGRVFVDLWDLEKFSNCPACFAARRERLQRLNLEQQWLPPIRCERCS